MKQHRKKVSANTLVFPKRMYFFILPALVLFLVFWVFPIIQLFFYSFTNFNGINPNYDFVKFKNYIRLFEEGTLKNSIVNTLKYAIVVVVGTNILGLAVAMALNVKLRGKAIFRTCSYLPALFSAIVVGFIWSYVFAPGNGMIATIMDAVGIDGSSLNLLGNYKTSIYAIAAIDIWKGFGTTMIIYLAGLQTVDESLLEAGRIDGCTEWQLFQKVKLPLISSTITINVILNVINGLKAFDYSFIMTNGGPGKSTNTLMFTIYKIAFTDMRMGKGSALAVMSFLVIIFITIIMLGILNKREVEL